MRPYSSLSAPSFRCPPLLLPRPTSSLGLFHPSMAFLLTRAHKFNARMHVRQALPPPIPEPLLAILLAGATALTTLNTCGADLFNLAFFTFKADPE